MHGQVVRVISDDIFTLWELSNPRAISCYEGNIEGGPKVGQILRFSLSDDGRCAIDPILSSIDDLEYSERRNLMFSERSNGDSLPGSGVSV